MLVQDKQFSGRWHRAYNATGADISPFSMLYVQGWDNDREALEVTLPIETGVYERLMVAGPQGIKDQKVQEATWDWPQWAAVQSGLAAGVRVGPVAGSGTLQASVDEHDKCFTLWSDESNGRALVLQGWRLNDVYLELMPFRLLPNELDLSLDAASLYTHPVHGPIVLTSPITLTYVPSFQAWRGTISTTPNHYFHLSRAFDYFSLPAPWVYPSAAFSYWTLQYHYDDPGATILDPPTNVFDEYPTLLASSRAPVAQTWFSSGGVTIEIVPTP